MKTNIFFKHLLIITLFHIVFYKIGFQFYSKIIHPQSYALLADPIYWLKLAIQIITIFIFYFLIFFCQKENIKKTNISSQKAIIIGICFLFMSLKVIPPLSETIFSLIPKNILSIVSKNIISYSINYQGVIELLIVAIILTLSLLFLISTLPTSEYEPETNYHIYFLIFGLSYSLRFIPLHLNSYLLLFPTFGGGTLNFHTFFLYTKAQNALYGLVLILILYHIIKKISQNRTPEVKQQIRINSNLSVKISCLYSLIPVSILGIFFKLIRLFSDKNSNFDFLTFFPKLCWENIFHVFTLTVSLIAIYYLTNVKKD